MPDPGLPKTEESKTKMVRAHGENGRGTASETNYAGEDAGEEVDQVVGNLEPIELHLCRGNILVWNPNGMQVTRVRSCSMDNDRVTWTQTGPLFSMQPTHDTTSILILIILLFIVLVLEENYHIFGCWDVFQSFEFL